MAKGPPRRIFTLKALKRKLADEGGEQLFDVIEKLKLVSAVRRYRATDTAKEVGARHAVPVLGGLMKGRLYRQAGGGLTAES